MQYFEVSDISSEGGNANMLDSPFTSVHSHGGCHLPPQKGESSVWLINPQENCHKTIC